MNFQTHSRACRSRE
ncbi:hypothetical protein [Blautia producta]